MTATRYKPGILDRRALWALRLLRDILPELVCAALMLIAVVLYLWAVRS